MSFVQKAALQGDFKLSLTDPSQDFPAQNLTGHSAEYHDGSLSRFDLCVYATAAGYVDLCIGDFTMTDRRLFETNWIKLQSRPLHVVVPFTYGEDSLWDDALTLFQPFQWQTWVFMLAFVVPIFSLFFFVFDDGNSNLLLHYEPVAITLQSAKEARSEPQEYVEFHYIPWYKRLGRALSVAYLSLATRSYGVDAMSTPAKINAFGFTIFLFGFSLTYTANLAAQLTVRQLTVPVSSFEEAQNRNYRFCVTRKKYEVVHSLHPSVLPTQFVLDNHDSLPGFENSGAGFSALQMVLQHLDPLRADTDPRFCHAAILPAEHIEHVNSLALQCNLIAVGEPVAVEPIGIPISPAKGGDLQYPHAFLQALEARGDFLEELAGARPTSSCPTDGMTSQESGFTIRGMGGIWAVSFGFLFMAAAVHWYEKFLRPMERNHEGHPMRHALRHNQWGNFVNTLAATISYMDWYTRPSQDGKHKILMTRRDVEAPPRDAEFDCTMVST